MVLDKAPTSDVTVKLTYSGTAADGSDFTAVTSVTIPAGQKTVAFDIATLGDADLEGSEVFSVALGEITGGGFEAIAVDPSANSVDTTIVDATQPPPPPNDAVVSIAGPGEVIEGQVASGYTVTLDKAPTSDVTVKLSYSGVAADGSDFTGVSSVVIKAGETSASFDIATLDDAYAEGSEAFTVTIAGTAGGGFDSLTVDASADRVTTTIVDDTGPNSPTPDAPAGDEDTAHVSIAGPGEVVRRPGGLGLQRGAGQGTDERRDCEVDLQRHGCGRQRLHRCHVRDDPCWPEDGCLRHRDAGRRGSGRRGSLQRGAGRDHGRWLRGHQRGPECE